MTNTHAFKITLMTLCSLLLGNTPTITSAETEDHACYDFRNNDSELQTLLYKTYDSALRYLAYRDIPGIIKKYVHGKKALDYGVGTGFSADFLYELGFEVCGADINPHMLAAAQQTHPELPLFLIKNNYLPLSNLTQDLVFSSFVLFEIGSESQMTSYLEEAQRVLKHEGIFIALTGSQEVYTRDWAYLKVDYPENENLKSGDVARSYVIDADIEFIDYFWTEADYRKMFANAKLEILEVHYPLGKAGDPYFCKDELTYSPYLIIIAKKK